jgi:protease II
VRLIDAKQPTSAPIVVETNYTVALDDNPEPGTREVRYLYTSLSTPFSTYVYDVAERSSTLLKQEAAPGGFDSKNYETDYLFATAKDGTNVPISLVRRKGVKRDGSAPLHLYGYGSYGYPVTEYEEWGNPSIAEQYRWMRAYSPTTTSRRSETQRCSSARATTTAR